MATVSVVIPTFERASLLPRAVNSVLSQTYERIEVIVVDDASTDETESVMREYDSEKVKYIQLEKNQGGSHARNVGIEHASGEYLAFLDDDDEWRPTKLEKQVDLLDSLADDWVGVYTGVAIERSSFLKRIFDVVTGSAKSYPTGDIEIQASLLTMTDFVHGGSTLLVRSDVVQDIGGFDEAFPRRQDIEFVLRLTNEGKIACIEEGLAVLHDTPGASPEEIIESQHLLMSEFNTEVKHVESLGYDVTGVHNLYVARQKLRQSEYQSAFGILRRSRPKNLRHIAGICVDCLRGVSNIIS